MGLRPEDVGDYKIYCFNEAVAIFGMIVESELDQVEGKTQSEIDRKKKQVLDQYLGTESSKTRGQFADPAAMFAAQQAKVGDA